MVGLSVFLQQDISPKDGLELAKLAEESGFKHIWLNDSQDVFLDCWAEAGMMAVNTSRIRIGPGVTNPLTRHPRVTATAALTIHEISGGRADLGIGTGSNAIETLGWKPASAKATIECVEICREKFRDHGADIPIYMAAGGPRMQAYAYKEADGIFAGGGKTPQQIRSSIEQFKAKIKEVGRRKEKVELLLAVPFAISHDRREAMDDMRGPVANRMTHVVERPETWPRDLEHLRPQAEKVAKAYDMFNHGRSRTPRGEFASHAKLVTDEMVDYFALFGTPEEVAPKFKALWEEAAQHEGPGLEISVRITPNGSMQGGKLRSFKLFVHDVLPKLRSR